MAASISTIHKNLLWLQGPFFVLFVPLVACGTAGGG